VAPSAPTPVLPGRLEQILARAADNEARAQRHADAGRHGLADRLADDASDVRWLAGALATLTTAIESVQRCKLPGCDCLRSRLHAALDRVRADGAS
jgi:hypothetical protein